MSTKKLTIGKKSFTPLGGRINTLLSMESLSATAFARSLNITDAYLSRLMRKGGKGGDKFWRGITKAFPLWESYLRLETERPPIKKDGSVADTLQAMESGPGQLRLPELDRYRVVQVIGPETQDIQAINSKLDRILDLILRHDREIEKLKRREKNRAGDGHEKKAYLAMIALLAFVDLAAGQEIYYTKEGASACLSEAALDRFIDFQATKDLEAMAKLITSGRCVLLKDGIPVYRESLGFKSSTGKIKIRPKGETESSWTTSSAIQKK